MPRSPIENVEIQEPPLQEIKKNRSCVKHACFTGCGCIVIFLIALILFVKYIVISSPKEIKSLPANFPSEIPLYDMDSVTKMTFLSGAKKARTVKVISFVPRLLASRFVEKMQPAATSSTSAIFDNQEDWQQFLDQIKNPTVDKRDTVEIEWIALPAEQNFIIEYYEKGLEKNAYTTRLARLSTSTRQLYFEKETIDGTLFVSDSAETKETDYILLTVNY